jgi:hypothetical protein
MQPDFSGLFNALVLFAIGGAAVGGILVGVAIKVGLLAAVLTLLGLAACGFLVLMLVTK